MDTMIVIMLKNSETGFLETEIGSYNVNENDLLIYNIFALKNNTNEIDVHMRLSVERDLEDWEFSAVLDYYDTQALAQIVVSIREEDSEYNPIWEIVFPFDTNHEIMERKISQILQVHKIELESVYEAISELKYEYI